jgi:hypothetical protein
MAKKYMVDLKAEEQEMLTSLIGSGSQRVRKFQSCTYPAKSGRRLDRRTNPSIFECQYSNHRASTTTICGRRATTGIGATPNEPKV